MVGPLPPLRLASPTVCPDRQRLLASCGPRAKTQPLMKPLGDRRARVRLDVLGTLRGTLELSEPARLLNISKHGALVEATTPVALGSFQELLLMVEGRPVRVAGRVRRLETMGEPGKQEREKYLIGLEFLSPSSSLTDSIEHLADES